MISPANPIITPAPSHPDISTGTDSIEVICATDDRFLPYCAAMIESLVRNAQGTRYTVSLLIDRDVSALRLSQLEAFLANRLDYRLFQVQDVDLARIDIPHAYLSRSVYFRLILDHYLPSTLSRILFLDCDLYIAGCLQQLWEQGLNGFPCAAVEIDYIDPQHLRSLGLEGHKYFNAGVLLLDLDYWRKHSLGERAANWIRMNQDTARFWDQDALNVLLADNWNKLDPCYNVTSSMLSRALPDASAKIIHFTGREKPWHYLSTNPYKEAYLDCVRKTPWPEADCVDFSLANVARKYSPPWLRKSIRNSLLWQLTRRLF